MEIKITKIGNIYFHGSRNKKEIALTFDDGPCQETLEILKILGKNNSKATFFIWGEKIKGNEEVLRKIIEQESEIGNHSFNHLRLIFKNRKKIEEQIIKRDEELKRLRIKINLFRPPASRIGFNLWRVTKKLNKKIILFDVISNDWKKPEINYIINKVMRKAKNGSIISFHDYIEGVGRNEQIIPALKIIIPELKKRGYNLVTVLELLDL